MNTKIHFPFWIVIILSFTEHVYCDRYLEFRPYDVGYSDAFVSGIEQLGEYHFVLAQNRNRLYRKKDSAHYWEVLKKPQNLGDKALSLKALHNRIYLGDGEYYMYYSEDSGRSWNATSDSLAVDNSIFYKNELFTFYNYGFQGVKHSTDFGKTWATSLATNEQLFLLTKGENNLYCGGWGTLYVSKNSGAHWDTISTGLPSKTAVTSLVEFDANILLVATDKGLYKTENGGQLWQLVSEEFSKVKSNGITKMVVVRNKKAYFLTTKGELYEVDGNSFSIMLVSHTANNSNTTGTIASIDSTLYASGKDGIYCYTNTLWSRDGASIEGITLIDTLYQTESYNFLQIYTPDNKGVLLRNDLYSDTWTPVLVTEDRICSVIPTDSYIRVVTTNVGGIDLYISSTGGASWTEMMTIDDESPLPKDKTGKTLVYENQVLFHDGINLYKSLDKGKNWSHNSKYIFDELVSEGESVIAVERVPLDKGETNYLWFSGDFGENFQRVSDSTSFNTSNLCVRDGLIYGVKDDRLNISRSLGKEWELSSHGEEIQSIDYASRSLVIVSKLLGKGFYLFKHENDNWYELEPIGNGGSTSFHSFGEFILAIENETVYKAREESSVSLLCVSPLETQPYITTVNRKQLTLSCNNLCSDVNLVQLLSLTGKVLIEKNVTLGESGTVALDRSFIASGLYIVAIKGDKNATFSVVHLP